MALSAFYTDCVKISAYGSMKKFMPCMPCPHKIHSPENCFVPKMFANVR